MSILKREFIVFLTAVMFFTRIPVPGNLPFSAELLNQASRWFPFVGWIVGVWIAGVYWVGVQYWSPPIAVGTALAFGLLLTGSFHEDGFADVCDGFGGGYTADKVLEIMKDSRLGTYGAAGLFFMLGLKWLLLSQAPPRTVIWAFFAGHALSRAAPLVLLRFSRYARKDSESKAKPLATTLTPTSFLVGILFGLTPLLLSGLPFLWMSVFPVLVVTLILMKWFESRIGGYTGDCLGAVQQVSELIIYLCLAVTL